MILTFVLFYYLLSYFFLVHSTGTNGQERQVCANMQGLSEKIKGAFSSKMLFLKRVLSNSLRILLFGGFCLLQQSAGTQGLLEIQFFLTSGWRHSRTGHFCIFIGLCTEGKLVPAPDSASFPTWALQRVGVGGFHKIYLGFAIVFSYLTFWFLLRVYTYLSYNTINITNHRSLFPLFPPVAF